MNRHERRRYEHVPFSMDLVIVDQKSQSRFKAHSINLSLGGVAFYAERFLESGTRITVLAQLGRSEGDNPAPIPATVAWAKVEADGAIMGVGFDAPLSPATHPKLCERLYRK